MTTSGFPFNSYREWAREHIEIWTNTVWVEPSILRAYDSRQSVLIHGIGGSGLSTLGQVLKAKEKARGALVVEWIPGTPVVPDLIKTVVRQLDEEIVDRIAGQGGVEFSDTALETWSTLLTEYQYDGKAYGTTRWFRRHLGVAKEETLVLQQARERHSSASLTDIVDDILEVGQAIGYSEIVCMVSHVSPDSIPHLQAWIDERSFQSRRGLRSIILLPTELCQRLRDTSRWSVFQLQWTKEQIREITQRTLSTALQRNVLIPDNIFTATSPLFNRELGMTPYGAVSLAEALYWWLQREGQMPTDVETETLHHLLYQRRIPLHYDPVTHQLYRGLLRLPTLNNVPREVFEVLYTNAGLWVNKESLLDIVGSSSNLHAVIRRIRTEIEPKFRGKFPPVYLETLHGQGYKLDNIRK